MFAIQTDMTDFSAAHTGIQHRPGKHNMASAAFQDLQTARREGRAPEGGQVSFGDIIDTLNPLQHIPVVGEAYRSMTGDSISPQARIAGGALWGGPLGLVASVASLAMSGNGEEGLGDRVYASLFGGKEQAQEMAIASADAPKPEALPDNTELLTASIVSVPEPQATLKPAIPASAGNPAETKPLPRLSPEAFQALLGSFADPAEDKAGSASSKPAPAHPSNLSSAMLDALDKYEAMKSETSAR